MSHNLVVLWTAFKIGWENESNWTKRPVYFLYAAARPLAMCLILYFLFRVASANPSTNETFVSVYLSNAFFTIFMAVSGGVAWVIMEDREWFRITKYIVIAPMNYPVYIFGRALVLLLVSFVSTTIILLFGRFVLGIAYTFTSINWGLLGISFFLGLASTAAMGMMLAGFCLITARHSTLLAEGVGGAFLLVCGVIYPVDMLPKIWQVLSLEIPLTYWMEATRRAFSRPSFGQLLAGWSNFEIMFALTATTGIFIVLAMGIFRGCYDYAKKEGKLDQVTHH